MQLSMITTASQPRPLLCSVHVVPSEEMGCSSVYRVLLIVHIFVGGNQAGDSLVFSLFSLAGGYMVITYWLDWIQLLR